MLFEEILDASNKAGERFVSSGADHLNSSTSTIARSYLYF